MVVAISTVVPICQSSQSPLGIALWPAVDHKPRWAPGGRRIDDLVTAGERHSKPSLCALEGFPPTNR